MQVSPAGELLLQSASLHFAGRTAFGVQKCFRHFCLCAATQLGLCVDWAVMSGIDLVSLCRFRLLASYFSLGRQRKVTKRQLSHIHVHRCIRASCTSKCTLIARVSCALRKFAVVPTRHPCRDVTQTHFLCVCHQISSSARRAHKGVLTSKAKCKSVFCCCISPLRIS